MSPRRGGFLVGLGTQRGVCGDAANAVGETRFGVVESDRALKSQLERQRRRSLGGWKPGTSERRYDQEAVRVAERREGRAGGTVRS